MAFCLTITATHALTDFMKFGKDILGTKAEQCMRKDCYISLAFQNGCRFVGLLRIHGQTPSPILVKF